MQQKSLLVLSVFAECISAERMGFTKKTRKLNLRADAVWRESVTQQTNRFELSAKRVWAQLTNEPSRALNVMRCAGCSFICLARVVRIGSFVRFNSLRSVTNVINLTITETKQNKTQIKTKHNQKYSVAKWKPVIRYACVCSASEFG